MPLTPDEAKEVVLLAAEIEQAAAECGLFADSRALAPSRGRRLRKARKAFTRYIDQLTEKKP